MITVGEILKKQRESLNKDVEQVALDTKIQPRFIKYIEANDFDKFDSPIYAQGFIKIYAKYLDLDEDKILAIYRRSIPEIKEKNKSLRETKPNVKRINITPKIITITLSIFFLVSILGYIGYQIYQFQSPPRLNVSSPENDLTVNEQNVEVLGATDTNTTLFVNDNPVEVNNNGEFSYQLELNPGVNLITILAKKNNSVQETIETIKINYEVQQEQNPEQETPEKTPNIVRLETVNSSVWIQFNVDKVNKISQIVQSGEKYEYEVENQFSLTTGIINSTKIFFNDKQLKINRGSSSIGSLNCEIIDNDQINCE